MTVVFPSRVSIDTGFQQDLCDSDCPSTVCIGMTCSVGGVPSVYNVASGEPANGYNSYTCSSPNYCPNVTVNNAVFNQSLNNQYATGKCNSGYTGTPYLLCNQSSPVAVWSPASSMLGCCSAVCSPVCQHGGACIAPNTCSCGVFNGVLYSGPTCATANCIDVIQSNAFWPTSAVGVTVSGICVSGYVGTVSRSCATVSGVTGFQAITGQCIVNTTTCAAMNASNIMWPATYANQFGYGTCASGYIPTGEAPYRFCSNAAVWGTSVGSCSVAQCQSFTDSQAAWPTSIANSAVVNGFCLPGTSGTITRTCSVSGVTPVWSASTGSCN